MLTCLEGSAKKIQEANYYIDEISLEKAIYRIRVWRFRFLYSYSPYRKWESFKDSDDGVEARVECFVKIGRWFRGFVASEVSSKGFCIISRKAMGSLKRKATVMMGDNEDVEVLSICDSFVNESSYSMSKAISNNAKDNEG